MKRSSVMATLVAGLALCVAACQKAGQAPGNTAGAGSTNSPAGAQSGAAPQQPAAPQTHLKVGDRAPDFELTDTEGQKVRLSDFKGKKNVVLAFYVLAFTGGCTKEMKA